MHTNVVIRPTERFTSVPNAVVALIPTIGALGFAALVWAMSKPDGFRFTTPDLMAGLGVGERAWQAARRNLVACGAVETITPTGPRGRKTGKVSRWSWPTTETAKTAVTEIAPAPAPPTPLKQRPCGRQNSAHVGAKTAVHNKTKINQNRARDGAAEKPQPARAPSPAGSTPADHLHEMRIAQVHRWITGERETIPEPWITAQNIAEAKERYGH